MNSNDLSEQLNQYIQQLIKIQQLLSNQQQVQQSHLTTLREKLALKICQFRLTIQKLNMKEHSPSVLAQMSMFIKNSFTVVIKEAHRMIQIKSSTQNQDKLKGKIGIIKEMEGQMDSIWYEKERKSDGVLKRLNDNISMLSQKLDYSQLKNIAKDYLHKMIAYKLYEQYVAHSHSKIKQQLLQIKESQYQLQLQAEELKDFNKELKSQEKRLLRQLNQLKKVNDMIGKRYFVTEEKVSPQKKY